MGIYIIGTVVLLQLLLTSSIYYLSNHCKRGRERKRIQRAISPHKTTAVNLNTNVVILIHSLCHPQIIYYPHYAMG